MIEIRLDVHHHFHGLGNTAEVIQLLTELKAQGKIIMASIQDLNNTIAQIGTATDTIAAEIAALQAQISADATPEQLDTVNAALGGIVTRLQSIGTPATPAGNVPPADPTPPAPVDPNAPTS